MKWSLLIASLTIFLISCTELEYSPHQVYDKHSPLDLNAKNLTRLLQTGADDTVRFIVSGDSQRSYDEVKSFVRKANAIQGLDLVFLAGDISEFGTLKEMEWVVREFQTLTVPFFGVIGNHDLLANGPAVYKRMFGELNYSFIYKGVKFICHDTNGREYNFNGKVPDLNWLQNQLSDETAGLTYIGVSHVRPFTVDFDSKLDSTYANLFNGRPNFLASFHGHDHSFGEYYANNSRVPFLVTTTIKNNGFLLGEIINNQISYERIEY